MTKYYQAKCIECSIILPAMWSDDCCYGDWYEIYCEDCDNGAEYYATCDKCEEPLYFSYNVDDECDGIKTLCEPCWIKMKGVVL